MKMKRSLKEILEEVEDFRREKSVEHNLIDILIISIIATICGAAGYVQIHKFAEAKFDWLKTFLELPNGIPSSDTIRRVMMKINPKEFHKAFIEWVQIICEKNTCRRENWASSRERSSKRALYRRQ